MTDDALALITLLPAKLQRLAQPNSSRPVPQQGKAQLLPSSRLLRQPDLSSLQGQDANMTGESLGPWLSREVWYIINHTSHLNAAVFNVDSKN